MEKLHIITISNNYCYDMAEVVSYLKEYNNLCLNIPLKDKDYEFIEKSENGIILHAFVDSVKKHKEILLSHLEYYFKGLQAPKIEYKFI